MLQSKNVGLRKGWWILPFLVVSLAGCNRNTTANRPESSAPASTAATASHANSQIDLATSGTISGTIHFIGKAPTPIVIDMAQDPACSLATQTPNTTEQYIVRDGKLANVFVYVEDGLGNRIYPPSQTPVILDQKGCRFTPHVIGAMVGQAVEFRNGDPTTHNVHIVPPGQQDTDGFDLSQAPMNGTEQHIFQVPGLMIPVRCNNHPWMEAFLNVASNPFFAVSDNEGHYEIQGLPPGKYTLVAVQEKLGTQTQQITVTSHTTTAANFSFSK